MRKISLTVNRLIALLLVFILGFLSCVGAIVGVGYLAYSKVSLDWLEELGLISVNDEDYIDPEAEVSLSAMTLQGMIAEMQALAALEKDITIDVLLERYGLTLSKEAEELIPEGMKTVSLEKLFGSDGITYVLDNTKVEYIFKFVPEDALSAPARELLKDKTFGDVIKLDLGYLLDGVALGYILGVKYEKDVDGEYSVVYKDAASPTLVELIAPLQIGEVLNVFANGGDLLEVIENNLGNVMMKSLLGSFIDMESSPLAGIIGDKALSDILVLNEKTGNYTLDILNVLKGRTFADVLDYNEVYEHGILVGYTDKDGNKVVGLMRGLGGVLLDDITEEGFQLSTLLEDVYLGDLLEYNPVFDYGTGEIIAWNNSKGEEVGALEGKLAAKTFGEVMGNDFEAANLLDGMFVGDLLGHEALYEDSGDPEKRTGWKDENGEKVTGLDNAIANIDLGKMLGDSDYEVTSVLDGVMLGEVMGNTPIYDSDDKIIGWEDENEEELKGIDKAVANIDIGRLVNDSEYKIEDAFNDLYIGEMLGYEKGEQLPPDDPFDPDERIEFKWYEIDDTDPNNVIKTEVTGVNAKLSNYVLGKIISGDEKLSADEIAGDLTIAEVLGLEAKEFYVTEDSTSLKLDGSGDPIIVTYWYDSNDVKASGVISAIAGLSVDAIDSEIDNIFVGAAIGLIEIDGEWVDTEEGTVTVADKECIKIKKAEGLICHMADLKIKDLKDADTVDAKIEGIYVGEVLGHNPVYDGEGNILYWTDGETGDKLTGFLGVIVARKVGDIDNTILDELTIAEVMDYERHCKVHGESTEGCPDDCTEKAIWYKRNGDDSLTKITGVMSAIAGYTVSSLDSEIDSLYLGDVMGFTFECPNCENDDTSLWCEGCKANVDGEGTPSCTGNCSGGKWYDDEGEEIDGVMSSFVNLTVDDMSDDDKITAAIKTVKVSDAMGYKFDTRCTEHTTPGTCPDDCTKAVEGWYDTDGNLVTGLMKSVADKTVGEMDGIMNTITVAEVMGYTYDQDTDTYYDGEVKDENEVIGLMGAVCGYKINELDDRLGHLYIGDVMDFYFVGNTCNDCESDDVSGWCDECKENLDGEGNPQCTGHCAGGKWYKDKDHKEEAHGVMAAFARLTINEMRDNQKITNAMQNVSVGEALGYEQHCEHCQKINDRSLDCDCKLCDVEDCPLIWYSVGDTKLEPVTGIMKTIVNSDIGHLNTDLENTLIGDILGYTFVDPDENTEDDEWWYDESSNKTTTLINRLCYSTVGNLSKTLNDLTVTDIFAKEDMKEGSFLILLKPKENEPAIKLSELGTKTNEIFQETTMGDYYKAELIINDDIASKLDAIQSINSDFDWREMTLTEFVNSVTSLLIPSP